MRKFLTFVTTIVFVALSTASTITAQSLAANAAPSAGVINPLATASRSAQIVSALASLPEADTIIYVNPQRILNDVVPKLMPAKDVEEMRKGFEAAKNMAGVDPTKIEYIVIAVRFKKPTANLDFQPPEFLAIASGDFSADALITLARAASQGKLRDEKYGARTLGLMTIDPVAKMAETNPFLKSFTEVGLASLAGNTIAAGTPGYLRAAMDAADGKERINVETLNSLVRDPNALISIAGTPWHSFAKSFGMLGVEGRDRAARCDSKIGDFYAALTMDATNFMLRGAMNEDNPDTAKIVSRLFSTLLAGAGSSIKDAEAQSLLKSIAITADGDEVRLSADVPQQTVIEFIQQQTKKPAANTSEEQKQPMKAKTRRSRRRRHD
ncbi:MAG TPA: hypothetical protein VJT50_01310 [Pyrinomonadaceae bacterium]|nr:hypothetical protein [Pyrinomonadaceae bacterium]